MLQAFATLILGARGRSNIFQHHTAFARCLAVSILFQGGPGIGSTKRIQNRFRLEGAPAVAMSVVLQLEEHVLKKRWWLLKPRSSGQFYTKGGPKNGSARRPQFWSRAICAELKVGPSGGPIFGAAFCIKLPA